MKTNTLVVTVLSAVFLSGCWTLSETEFPTVDVAQAPAGKTVKVRFENYRSGINRYVPVEGHEVMDPEACKTNEVESSSAWNLRNIASSCLISRSAVELERKGYTIDRENPDYVISLRFIGPQYYEHDVLRQLGYMLCTLFTADYGAQNWRAKLKVHDVKTGRLVCERDFEQRYEAVVWGPIPFFSPLGSSATNFSVMKDWCLTVLTDVAVAEALDFLAKSPVR